MNFCNPQPQTPPTPETVCVFFSKDFSAVLLRKSLCPKERGGGGGKGGGRKKHLSDFVQEIVSIAVTF